MNELEKTLRETLKRNYINDYHLQSRIIQRFMELNDSLPEDPDILVSKFAGFLYSYLKNHLCSQDELAWEIFVSMYHRMFHKLLLQMHITHEGQREEVIQEFLFNLLNKCRSGKFNPRSDNRNAFISYIMTAFKRFAINYLQRNKNKRIQSIEDIEEFFPSFLVSSPELKGCDRIIHIMENNNFSTEEILIIRLKCDGYSQKEIAQIILRSEAYISRKYRATIKRLRELISGFDEHLYG